MVPCTIHKQEFRSETFMDVQCMSGLYASKILATPRCDLHQFDISSTDSRLLTFKVHNRRYKG